ncbi:UDP-N-acetylglucosamine pyrophosphorylase, partial [Fusarium oxysporum f. sp. albedinis]
MSTNFNPAISPSSPALFHWVFQHAHLHLPRLASPLSRPRHPRSPQSAPRKRKGP